jgi:hypothetical protein
MNTIKTLIVVLSLLFAGCSSPSAITKHVLHFDDRATNKDRAEQFEAAQMLIEEWQAYFDRQSGPLDIYVTMSKYTKKCGSIETAIGCYRPYSNRTDVVAGRKNSLPALFHELCHRNETSKKYGIDVHHKDILWKRWNLIGHTFSDIIAGMR